MRRLVLLHGSVGNGAASWRAQRGLAERWELVVPNRPGYPPGPPVAHSDFEGDAEWLLELLRPGDHLVGHSYGGVIALLAAPRAEGLASLTVVEPPAFGVARGHEAVERFVRDATELWAGAGDDPESFVRAFLPLVGSPLDPPSPLPPALEQGARTLMVERPPWEAEIPFAPLRTSGVPVLVVSGGHHEGFEAVADALGRELAAERAVLPGAGHAVQAAPGFNAALAEFLQRAESR